jgi:hypothetical protein
MDDIGEVPGGKMDWGEVRNHCTVAHKGETGRYLQVSAVFCLLKSIEGHTVARLCLVTGALGV